MTPYRERREAGEYDAGEVTEEPTPAPEPEPEAEPEEEAEEPEPEPEAHVATVPKAGPKKRTPRAKATA